MIIGSEDYYALKNTTFGVSYKENQQREGWRRGRRPMCRQNMFYSFSWPAKLQKLSAFCHPCHLIVP
jgi:hypothetical protein